LDILARKEVTMTERDELADFISTGSEYKKLAKVIKYEDGDRAWVELDRLRRKWIDAAWRLHDHLESKNTERKART